MTEQPEALRLADALYSNDPQGLLSQAAAELRRLHAVNQELLEQEQESVADLRCAFWLDPECADAGACQSLKFKSPPSRREWVPLTDDEINLVTNARWALRKDSALYAAHGAYARDVEAACKEKNK